MPLALAIDCHDAPAPADAAMPRERRSGGGRAKRRRTGRGRRIRAAPAPPRFAKAKVICCCDIARQTLARSGRPSEDQNSRLSSSGSTRPSNWKEPQMNRTAGGAYFGAESPPDPPDPPDHPTADPPAPLPSLRG